MKAAYIESTGGPEVIKYGDLPIPEPKPGEVRVKVQAASLNPIDTYVRSGLAAMGGSFPFITGRDFAGVVDAVGPNVKRYKIGDRVWGANQGAGDRTGSFAEYLVTGEDFAYPILAGTTDEQAAAGALVGITAHLGLFACGQLQPRQWVFVNGGTGGVGAMVIQMARAMLASVITTVGSDEKARIARELGANVVINYKTEDVYAKAKEVAGAGGIHVWYETQPPGDLDPVIDAMASRGRIIVMAGRKAKPTFTNGPFYVKGLSLHGFAMFNFSPQEQRACADDVSKWMVEGKLKAIIGQRLPMSHAADAHRLQEDNTLKKAGTLTGKIVVLPTA